MRKRIVLFAVGFLGTGLAAVFTLTAGGAALSLVQNGRSDYRIIVGRNATELEIRAAAELQKYVEDISGASLFVMTDDAIAAPREILVGKNQRLQALPLAIPYAELGPDGYVVITYGERLIIAGGSDQGTLYGVYTFLEEALGVRKYSKDVTIVPHLPTLRVGELKWKDVPFFKYRDVYMPDAFDDEYAAWHKLDNRRVRDKEWGLWVHTFAVFVPPGTYFKTHPEYFSETNGIRVPDGQLCLSNPAVFRLVVESLRERMKEKPEATYWSVSQNDTFLPCQCKDCLALDKKYGGPSGTLLWFVNRVAKEFPDKIISTLAYQYSRAAPSNIRPEKNVNIMLCTIECNRSRPIATDPANASFVKDIRDWTRLTNNILLWDYVVQFRNYCDPFPNLRVLQPNVRFFLQNRVPMIFEQGSGTSRSEFHELRGYLLAKLLWNPNENMDAVLKDFLNGFYGKAAPFLLKYVSTLHDALDASGGDLGIYGFPWDGVRTYLTPELLETYTTLFDRAEAAVATDPARLQRVRTARLPLEFAILEVSKRNVTPAYSVFLKKDGDMSLNPAMPGRLARFVGTAKAAGYAALQERGTSPDAYKLDMEWFFADGMKAHLGRNKPVRILTAWSEKYPVGGPAALTDGLKGTDDYHCNWLGFEGTELEAVVDLEQPTEVKRLSMDFLQNIESWIWTPEFVEYWTSLDGVQFEKVVTVMRRNDEKTGGTVLENFAVSFPPRPARYVKVRTKSLLACPPWHKGAGGKAWIFTDEIVIE
jgi:hypothetical protein